MKKLIVFALTLCICTLTFAQDVEKETKKIKKVIQTAYVEGLQNEGDTEKIESGFHPDFALLGIGDGDDMWSYPIEEWKKNQVKKRKEGKLPLKEDEAVTVKFLEVDVTGSAAMVKLEFYIGEELTYIDYISLYKFKSGWKIVGKIFYKLK